jgi:hypothetical protein
MHMRHKAIHSHLLTLLAGDYEKDPSLFVTLPKETLDSSVVRVALSELRNEGYVEELVRGTIRLTARGYKAYRRTSPTAA